jgi:hypothetical protein
LSRKLNAKNCHAPLHDAVFIDGRDNGPAMT